MNTAAVPAAMAMATGLLLGPTAWACNVCPEDKVAATYDHGVLQQAAAHSHTVVFCEVKGPFDPASLDDAARRIDGIEADSVRTSTAPGAISFALDSSRHTPEAAVAKLQGAAPAGTRLSILKTMDGPVRSTR